MNSETDKMVEQMMIGSRRRGKFEKMNLQRNLDEQTELVKEDEIRDDPH
jgi:hypothetical protein